MRSFKSFYENTEKLVTLSPIVEKYLQLLVEKHGKYNLQKIIADLRKGTNLSFEQAIINLYKKINYHVRWAIKRDMPEIIKLAGQHPDFTNTNSEEINSQLLQQLKQRNTIAMIVEDEKDEKYEIHGVIVYYLEPKSLSVPFIIADSEIVYDMLLSKLKNKIGERRNKIFMRLHFDPKLSNPLKLHKINTQLQDEDDDIAVGVYHTNFPQLPPNLQLPSWEDWYKKREKSV